MYRDITAQTSLFDSDPEYVRPKYVGYCFGDAMPGLYSQHDVDLLMAYDINHIMFRFQPYVPARAFAPAYAYEQA